jgi:hypothetical protein
MCRAPVHPIPQQTPIIVQNASTPLLDTPVIQQRKSKFQLLLCMVILIGFFIFIVLFFKTFVSS